MLLEVACDLRALLSLAALEALLAISGQGTWGLILVVASVWCVCGRADAHSAAHSASSCTAKSCLAATRAACKPEEALGFGSALLPLLPLLLRHSCFCSLEAIVTRALFMYLPTLRCCC